MDKTLAKRISALCDELLATGVDALIATTPVSMGYLTGFHEQAYERFMALIISASGEYALICPAISHSQAARCGINDIRAWKDGESPADLLRVLAEQLGIEESLLAVDNDMPAHILLEIQAVLPRSIYRLGDPLLAKLMRVKDESEIRAMKQAARIADQATEHGLAAVRPGATERDVQSALCEVMRSLGGEPTFCTVATGANSAEPHHSTDYSQIKVGDIVSMDFGCSVDGYQSDITRIACCGQATDEMRRIYSIVYRAHKEGRNAIRPGIACHRVDEAARGVIESEGFGEQFVHRTGHGIGLRLHEEPFIIAGNNQPLEVGNCFSVEPGIYLPGKFGIRIENIVCVTPNGHESLNEEPPAELIELPID